MGFDEAEGKPPLSGVRVLEFSGLGPTPFGVMLLADLGADVLRIERSGAADPLGGDPGLDFLYRARASVTVDLKTDGGRKLARALACQADVLVEGFRPGAMERLGLGPDDLTALNERLVYARMSGWGQTGPLAGKAGHDINYLSMAGALHPIGPHEGPPAPPINFVGNFGGGGTFLALGVLAALNERHRSGKGQVLDVAMVDGISVLLTQLAGWMQMGRWQERRGGNLLDGSAYFYRCYETADGRFIAVGALEPQFHDAFIDGLGLDPADFRDHLDSSTWESRGSQVARIVATRSRADWIARFEDLDACVTPVLTLREAVAHPANVARGVHETTDRSFQPRPAPRFGRSVIARPTATVDAGRAEDALRHWSVDEDTIRRLTAEGAVRQRA